MRNICEKLLVFRPGVLDVFFFVCLFFYSSSGGHFDQWNHLLSISTIANPECWFFSHVDPIMDHSNKFHLSHRFR